MNSRFLRYGMVTAVALVLAAPAYAASTDEGANREQPIIVTARRSEERLQDVPISMTVMNQTELTRNNITSTADLGSYVPSLSVNQQFGPEKASFVIRGFVQPYHTAPTVGVYFADVIAPRSLGPTTSGNGAGVGSMFDLENIQVLKGPQGTLFGRNTTGGAILLVPTKPKDELGGWVEATGGSYNQRRFGAVLNVPLSETFLVRASGDWNKRDGYIKNHSGIGPDRFRNVNYFAGRLSILAKLTPDLENYTIFSYSRSKTHGDVPKLSTCTDQDGNVGSSGLGALLWPAACAQVARQNARGDGWWDVESNSANPLQLIKQWSVINTTTWNASDNLTIKNIASYSEYNELANFSLWGDNFSVFTGFPYSGPGSFPSDYFGIPLNGPPGTPLATIRLQKSSNPWSTASGSFTDELQFQGETGRLKWQAGAYIEITHPLGWNGGFATAFTNCSDILANICNPVYIPVDLGGGIFFPYSVGSVVDANTKDWFNDKALYAQATYALTDTLSLTGGVRYTWDRMRDLAEALNRTNNFYPPNGAYCQNVLRFNTAPPGVSVNATNASQYAVYTTDPTVCDVTTKIKSSRPTWLIDLEYKPIPDMMVYAKWARGYRMGSITSNSIGFETVGPEKLDLYEVGAKATFHGRISGYFNVAGFYNDFHDQQIGISPTILPQYQGVIPNASPNINAGHSRIWGIEVNSSFRLFESLKIDIGYTHLETKVLDIQLPTNIPPFYDPNHLNAQASIGDPLPLSPKNTVVISGTYMLPVPDAWGNISFGATFTHIDANWAEAPDATPTYLITEQNQLNLNADWRQIAGNPVDLGFFMTNVTNQGRIQFPSGAFNTISADGGHVNEPRIWGFRLKYRLGEDAE